MENESNPDEPELPVPQEPEPTSDGSGEQKYKVGVLKASMPGDQMEYATRLAEYGCNSANCIKMMAHYTAAQMEEKFQGAWYSVCSSGEIGYHGHFDKLNHILLSAGPYQVLIFNCQS